MALGFNPLSSAPLSAVASELVAGLTVNFTMTITVEAAMEDPYAAFVRSPTAARMYTAELTFRAA